MGGSQHYPGVPLHPADPPSPYPGISGSQGAGRGCTMTNPSTGLLGNLLALPTWGGDPKATQCLARVLGGASRGLAPRTGFVPNPCDHGGDIFVTSEKSLGALSSAFTPTNLPVVLLEADKRDLARSGAGCSTQKHPEAYFPVLVTSRPPQATSSSFSSHPMGKKKTACTSKSCLSSRTSLMLWLPLGYLHWGGDAEAANRSARCTQPKNPWDSWEKTEFKLFFFPAGMQRTGLVGMELRQARCPHSRRQTTRLLRGGWGAEQELPPAQAICQPRALIFSQSSILKPHRDPLWRQFFKEASGVRASQEPTCRTRDARWGQGWGIPWLSPQDTLMWSPARDVCLEIPTSPQRSS